MSCLPFVVKAGKTNDARTFTGTGVVERCHKVLKRDAFTSCMESFS